MITRTNHNKLSKGARLLLEIRRNAGLSQDLHSIQLPNRQPPLSTSSPSPPRPVNLQVLPARKPSRRVSKSIRSKQSNARSRALPVAVRRLGVGASRYKAATLVKYNTALQNFLTQCSESVLTVEQADKAILDYINKRYDDDPRPGQCQEMANLLSMLSLSHPQLKHHLPLSRRALEGWKIEKPSKSSIPLTRTMLMGFVQYFLSRCEVPMAAALAVAWAAYLRISEVMALRWDDIALPGDFRLSDVPGTVAGLNIRESKTGSNQFVLLSDSHVVRLLQQYHTSAESSHARLFTFDRKRYQLLLNDACHFFGLNGLRVTPHSCRIGGAYHDFMRGIPVENIAIKGRWSRVESIRHYLQNARGWMMQIAPSSEANARIKRKAKSLEQALEAWQEERLVTENNTN